MTKRIRQDTRECEQYAPHTVGGLILDTWGVVIDILAASSSEDVEDSATSFFLPPESTQTASSFWSPRQLGARTLYALASTCHALHEKLRAQWVRLFAHYCTPWPTDSNYSRLNLIMSVNVYDCMFKPQPVVSAPPMLDDDDATETNRVVRDAVSEYFARPDQSAGLGADLCRELLKAYVMDMNECLQRQCQLRHLYWAMVCHPHRSPDDRDRPQFEHFVARQHAKTIELHRTIDVVGATNRHNPLIAPFVRVSDPTAVTPNKISTLYDRSHHGSLSENVCRVVWCCGMYIPAKYDAVVVKDMPLSPICPGTQPMDLCDVKYAARRRRKSEHFFREWQQRVMTMLHEKLVIVRDPNSNEMSSVVFRSEINGE